MEKTFVAIEYSNGYCELPDKEGNSTEVSNSQILLEEKARDKKSFIEGLRKHLDDLNVNIDDLSIEIKEIVIKNVYFI